MFLALLASGLAETFGLAMIIGAYAIGLALSESRLRHAVEEKMGTLANAIVPIFFCTMGMLVDVTSLVGAIGVGAVVTVLAIIGKVFGSGVPALGVGFNLRGASRIGFGMLPRGEVALIVAGIGLSNGIIQQELFDIAIMMTIVTTIIAPIALKPLFTSGGSGLRKPGPEDDGAKLLPTERKRRPGYLARPTTNVSPRQAPVTFRLPGRCPRRRLPGARCSRRRCSSASSRTSCPWRRPVSGRRSLQGSGPCPW